VFCDNLLLLVGYISIIVSLSSFLKNDEVGERYYWTKKKNEVASQRPRSPNLKQPTKEIDNL